jgi:hypothetical protein
MYRFVMESGAIRSARLADLCTRVLHRLGDSTQRIWTDAEIDSYILRGAVEMADSCRLVWEQYFPSGPYNGTITLPAGVVEIERITWDDRALDATVAGRARRWDPRYQLTEGDVVAYTWQQDGPRLLRLIHSPAQQPVPAATYTGTFGIPRTLADVTDATISGTWGIPRNIPEHQPSPAGFGIPRNFPGGDFYLKIEHWRHFDANCESAEIPERYWLYLIDYAQWQALKRNGPGQNFKLAQLYKVRWDRGIARIRWRADRQGQQRSARFGGPLDHPLAGPPRPKLPWQYGSNVR